MRSELVVDKEEDKDERGNRQSSQTSTIPPDMIVPSSMPLTSSDILATSMSTGKVSPSLLTCSSGLSEGKDRLD